MAFPGVRQQKVLYATAKRVRDELGKGQEVMRSASARALGVTSATARRIVFTPQVDIIITGIQGIGEGLTASDTVDVMAAAAYDTAAGSTNRLCTQMTNSDLADNTVFQATLSGLNGNEVAAGQPIEIVVVESGGGTITEVYIQVNYILADDERSY
jgi:hypothetical protein